MTIELTAREERIFYLTGTAMTAKDISKELGIAPKTVDTYKDRARKKMRLTPKQFRRAAFEHAAMTMFYGVEINA